MRWRSTILIGPLLLAACAGEQSAQAHLEAALHALREGRLRDAEGAAERAVRRGGAPYEALRNFVRGNTAFARCLLAEKQAAMPQAEPFALDVAINYSKAARDSWKAAATSRSDWPEARRNVERALLKIEELEQKKAEQEKRRKQTDPKPTPQPKPQPKTKPTPQKEAKPKLQVKQLPPEEVKKLLDRLAQKEREKLALRRTQRKARMAGERDW